MGGIPGSGGRLVQKPAPGKRRSNKEKKNQNTKDGGKHLVGVVLRRPGEKSSDRFGELGAECTIPYS